MDQEVATPAKEVCSFIVTVPESSINTVASQHKLLFRYGSTHAYGKEGFARTQGDLRTFEVRLAAKCPQNEFAWRRSTAREAIHIYIDLTERLGEFITPKAIMTSSYIYSLMNYLRIDFPTVVVEYGKEGYGFSTMLVKDMKESVPSFWVREVR